MSGQASGGFNTGRMYSMLGQRIFWKRDEDGTVHFADIDRLIYGTLREKIPEPPCDLFRVLVMQAYDKGQYDMAIPFLVPDDTEFLQA